MVERSYYGLMKWNKDEHDLPFTNPILPLPQSVLFLCTTHYNTAAPHHTVQHHITPNYTALHYTTPHFTTVQYTAPYCAIQHCTSLTPLSFSCSLVASTSIANAFLLAAFISDTGTNNPSCSSSVQTLRSPLDVSQSPLL